MAITIQEGDTPEKLAYEMLGDTRMASELFIPGWHQGLPLPVGRTAYFKGEPIGPPSKNWTKPSNGQNMNTGNNNNG
jgi:hypothetical protein